MPSCVARKYEMSSVAAAVSTSSQISMTSPQNVIIFWQATSLHFSYCCFNIRIVITSFLDGSFLIFIQIQICMLLCVIIIMASKRKCDTEANSSRPTSSSSASTSVAKVSKYDPETFTNFTELIYVDTRRYSEVLSTVWYFT